MSFTHRASVRLHRARNAPLRRFESGLVGLDELQGKQGVLTGYVPLPQPRIPRSINTGKRVIGWKSNPSFEALHD